MASETPELALEFRSCGPLVERVEDDAFSLVVGRHLEQITITHPPECDPLVEKQRPRIRRTDEPSLKAQLREHQQLRVGRESQGVEHRPEVSAPAIERKRDGTILKLAIQAVSYTH